MNEIIVAVITGVFTFAGVVITVIYGNNKTAKNIKEHTSVTLYRIEQLEKKQDKHNNIISRMYKAEEDITLLKEKIKVENHRIDDLEGYHKPPVK